MSWLAIVALAAGAYALKLLGLVGIGARTKDAGLLLRLAALVPPALLAALVAVQTFAGDRRLVLDARAAGVAVAVVAVWRRAPFAVVVVLAAVTTATVRALSS